MQSALFARSFGAFLLLAPDALRGAGVGSLSADASEYSERESAALRTGGRRLATAVWRLKVGL